MKYLISISLLSIFIAFLSTPTVIMLIEKKSDISIAYDFSEEENQKENKEVKELKSDFNFKPQFEFTFLVPFKYNKITSENLSKHDNISEEIFIPPPELI